MTVVRVAIAAAVLAAAVLSRPARADGPVADPVGETAEQKLARRLAHLCSSREPLEIEAWSREMAGEGRRRAGTAFGASLLAGAAHELARVPGREAETIALWRETRAAAAPESVAALEGDWGLGSGLLAAGDPAEALAALESFERRALAGASVAFDARERLFLESAGRLATRTSPRLRAQALGSLGRFAEAADAYEAAAQRLLSDGPETAWDVLDDAARAAWRAGDRERALRDADRSVDASPPGRSRVLAERRRLFARHGLLDARGDPAPGQAADDAFAREAREALARVQGQDDAWSLALQAATVETLAGRSADAVPFFEWAFSDPGFLVAARRGDLERGQLLVGAEEALSAHDPERALRWLRTAESVSNAAIPGAEGLRLRIDEALAHSRDPSEPSPPEGDVPHPSTGTTRVPRAGLGGASGPRPGAEDASSSAPGETGGRILGAGRIPWAGLAAGVLAIGAATLWVRRRRRRREDPGEPRP